MQPEKEFAEVVGLIRKAQTAAYRSVNAELINNYWQVGEYISQRIALASWGEKTVEELALFIERKHPDLKGYSRSTIYRMRQFYETYRGTEVVAPVARQIQKADSQDLPIVAPPVRQLASTEIRGTLLVSLPWTHHLIILGRSKSAEERIFYMQQSSREHYSKRELDRQISSGLFERVVMGNQELPAALKDRPGLLNTFKSNYILEFLSLPLQHNEGDLQKALIAQMKQFIQELGKDFLFMGEEYRLQVGNSDFKTDLLFYHRGLQSMILFELKVDKFRPEYLGQLNFYLEALDRDVKKSHENPSIGILLCKDQDAEVVKYALNRSLSPAMVAAYQTQLPDKEVLRGKVREIFGG
jgi:predicted nuclease of restriction endonuclease-like (RecB) superfamily